MKLGVLLDGPNVIDPKAVYEAEALRFRGNVVIDVHVVGV